MDSSTAKGIFVIVGLILLGTPLMPLVLIFAAIYLLLWIIGD